jgi:site-specific DNA-cytosine methylase
MEVRVIGQMDNTIDHTFESANRVYDINGIAPTQNTCGGGGLQTKILEEDHIIVAMRGRNPDNPSSREPGEHMEQRLEPNVGGTSNTLTTVQKDNMVLDLCAGTHGYANNCILNQYRIRKLTPRECGRLMGVSDEDITKMQGVNSNSQLYKQFGNSIVVDVMCRMFENLNISNT